MGKRKNNNKKASNKQRKREKKNSNNAARAPHDVATTIPSQDIGREREEDVQLTYTLVDRGAPFREGEPEVSVPQRATPEVLARRRILPIFRRLDTIIAQATAINGGYSHGTGVLPKETRQGSSTLALFNPAEAYQRARQSYDYAVHHADTSPTWARHTQGSDLRPPAELKKHRFTPTPRAKALLSAVSQKKSAVVAGKFDFATLQDGEQQSSEKSRSEPISLLSLPNADGQPLRRHRRQEEKIVALHVPPIEYPYSDGYATNTGACKHSELEAVLQDTSYTMHVDILTENTGVLKGGWTAGVDPDTSYAGDVMLFPKVECVHKRFHLDGLIIAECDEPAEFTRNEESEEIQVGVPSQDATSIKRSARPVKLVPPRDCLVVAPSGLPRIHSLPEHEELSSMTPAVEPESNPPSRKAVRFTLPSPTTSNTPRCDKPVDCATNDNRQDKEAESFPSSATNELSLTTGPPEELPRFNLPPVNTLPTPLEVSARQKPRLWSTVATTNEPEEIPPSRKTVRFALPTHRTAEQPPVINDAEQATNEIESTATPPPPPQNAHPASPPILRTSLEAHNMPSNITELELLVDMLATTLNIAPGPSFLDMRGGLLGSAEEYGAFQ